MITVRQDPSIAAIHAGERPGRREGRAHRAWIRENVTAYLRLGCMLPTANDLARYMGIHSSTALRHLDQVLREDGIRTQVFAPRSIRRKYVVEGLNG